VEAAAAAFKRFSFIPPTSAVEGKRSARTFDFAHSLRLRGSDRGTGPARSTSSPAYQQHLHVDGGNQQNGFMPCRFLKPSTASSLAGIPGFATMLAAYSHRRLPVAHVETSRFC